MNEKQNLAMEKIENEHKNFKEKIKEMKSEDVYNMAGVIIFTEATIFHLNQLTIDEALCDLILKDGKTLDGAVRHIISKVRMKYGQMGDLPVEEFHSLIWDYYKMEPTVAKKAMETKNKVNKKEEDNQVNILDVLKQKKNNETVNGAAPTKTTTEKPTKVIPITKDATAGPLQMSLFEL